MLWYCAFTWQPGTSREEVNQRLLQTHAAGTNHPERMRGWYNLAGGAAGFMLVETNNLQELDEMLLPWMDLMSWDVRAIAEADYDGIVKHLQGEQTGKK